MNWINLSDFASILQAMVALFAAIYAVQSLPDFINQKRIENLSADARTALDRLNDLKKTLKQLCSAAGEKQYIPMLEEMPYVLHALQDILQRSPEVSAPIIQKLAEILKDAALPPGNKVANILSEVDPRRERKKELNFEKFSELKKKLEEIYNIPKNCYHSGVGKIWKTLWITFLVAIIFYFSLNIVNNWAAVTTLIPNILELLRNNL